MAHKGNYSNSPKGSMGNQAPAQVDGDQDFTVSGDTMKLGQDGTASPQEDMNSERSVECPDGYMSPGSPDEALSEFTGLKKGGRYSSLTKYDGEKTAIPKEGETAGSHNDTRGARYGKKIKGKMSY